jgi:hypothetical protein
VPRQIPDKPPLISNIAVPVTGLIRKNAPAKPKAYFFRVLLHPEDGTVAKMSRIFHASGVGSISIEYITIYLYIYKILQNLG